MIKLFFTILRLFFSSRQTHLLVLFQNNYELRGSGGFLTQLLDVTIGRMKISPSFRHDYHELKPKNFIPAPPEIQKYLKHQHWHLRDSNIFGDFEASARQVSLNYHSLFPDHKVSGVIAVNFHFLEKLLAVIGPVRMGTGGGKTFDEKNIFAELSSNVSDIDKHNLEALNNRKNILKTLCFRVVRTSFAKFWKWPAMIRLKKEALKTKDLQLFSTDAKMQESLVRKGLVPDYSDKNTKDFLWIVENNYLGLKSNRYIRRTVSRDVVFHLDGSTKKLSGAFVKVKVEWNHCGHYNYPLSGTYQSVVNISIPLAAQAVEVFHAPEKPEIMRTSDSNLITFHQILGIQHSSSIEFSYRLPAGLFEDGKYNFLFIKQSGVLQEDVRETVRFPDQYGAEVEKFSRGAEMRTVDNVVFMNSAFVDRDYHYECGAVLHHQPPRIFLHEMVGSNTFEIRFNEPVFAADDFSVRVTNEKGTHSFKIEKTEFEQDNRHLVIHTHGIPQEEEKFYKIILNGLVNGVGTPLGERSVTAVHRSKYFSR